MPKRFEAKDWTLFTILAVLFVTLLLAMYMIDRQWLKLAEIEHSMSEQANDIRELRKQTQVENLSAANQHIQITNSSAANSPASKDFPPSFARALAATKQPDYSTGDWLVQTFGANIKTLTPLVSTDKYASDVQDFVIETLLTYNPDTLELIGHIASSWTISKDGLTIVFHIRKDVNFSDGVKLTAHDIEFSYRFVMNEKIDAPRQRAYYEKIRSVKALDDYTVEYKFREPYFNALQMVGSMEILAKHYYEPYLKDPNSFNQAKGLLFGTGPYRLKDPKNWSSDKGVVELVRNPRYWGPVTPPYERILWKVIENDSARLTTFRNGEIDAYGARPTEYAKLRNDKALMKRVQNQEYYPAINGYFYIGWNQTKQGKPTPFADKRVRLAMTYLTDRERLIKEVFLGYAESAVSPFNPNSRQHDESVSAYPVDLNKAKKLLSEAGFEDRNGDGILEDAAGNKFEFDLVFAQSSEDYKRVVLMLKDFYAKAGILMNPKPTEWPVMLEMTKNRNFDAMILGWTSVVETDLYQIFHSSQIKDNGDNFVSYANPILDKLIETARTTVDADKRMVLWHKCEKILHEDQPYTFLYRRKSLAFIDNRFRNLQITKFGLNLDRTPIESFVPKPLQRYK